MSITKKLFFYPFQGERAFGRLALATFLAVLRVPTLGLAMFPVWGFAIGALRHTLREGEPAMPEWSDWGTLLRDGFRYWVVRFIYLLPMMLIFAVMMVVLIGGTFALPFALIGFEEELLNATSPEDMVALSTAFTMGISLLTIPFSLALVPVNVVGSTLVMLGTIRMVEEDRLGAAFELRELWAMLKRNWLGYGVAVLIWMVIYTGVSFAIQMISATIVLYCLLVVLMPFSRVYSLLLAMSLFGNARHAEEQERPSLLPGWVSWDVLGYAFQHENWRRIGLTGMLLGAAALVFPPVGWLLNGYRVRLIREAISGEGIAITPWGEWSRLLKEGVQAWVIGVVYALPLWVMYGGVAVLTVLAAVIAAQAGGEAVLVSAFSVGVTLLSLISPFVLPLSLVAGYFSQIGVMRYAATGSVKAGLTFKEVWALGKVGFKPIVTAWVIMSLAVFGVSMVANIVYATVIGLLLFPFVTGALAMYNVTLSAPLMGRAYRQIMQENPDVLSPVPAEGGE